MVVLIVMGCCRNLALSLGVAAVDASVIARDDDCGRWRMLYDAPELRRFVRLEWREVDLQCRSVRVYYGFLCAMWIDVPLHQADRSTFQKPVSL